VGNSLPTDPMTPFLIVGITAFLAAGLTMYSGFGLGTLMLPVFALFFPIVAAIFGALALGWVAQSGTSITVEVNDETFSEITPVKLLIGFAMICFALFELLPRFRSLEFDRRYLPLGGVLSGFFGGFSGHQGALRSAFLAKAGLTTERFVSSNAVIGFLVDLTRISVYVALFTAAGGHLSDFSGWPLVITGAISAFCGVMLGKRFLHKVRMTSIQTLVGILLFGVGLALITGVL